MHQVLGAVTFSSLLFIGVRDIIPVIIRLGLSATIAQYIRVFEISGLLVGLGQSHYDYASSVDQPGESKGRLEEPNENSTIDPSQKYDIAQPKRQLSASTVHEHSPRILQDEHRVNSGKNLTPIRMKESKPAGLGLKYADS